jgi:hypothetical protein
LTLNMERRWPGRGPPPWVVRTVMVVPRRSSDRGRGAQSLVYREESAVMYGRDQMVVLCLQAHHMRLQIGDTPIEQTNLL